MSDKVRGIIAAGIRQYCSDLTTEYAYHEPTRDCSLLQRLHDDADSIARYIDGDGLRNCEECEHQSHGGLECGAPITEDIRVGRGTYDPVGSFYRSIIVDTCHCGLDNERTEYA